MKIFRQLCIILLIAFVGEVISGVFSLPMPGSIIGMMILLVLLKTKVIKLSAIQETADFLLDNMTFFFIPAGVSIMATYHYLEGFYIAGVSLIFITTIIVMAISGLTAEYLSRCKDHKSSDKSYTE